jgi:hypothetical protein
VVDPCSYALLLSALCSLLSALCSLLSALCSLLAGIVLYSAAIINHGDPEPVPKGEYVRLFILDITFWGPMVLLAVWQVSVPVLGALGVLGACVRKIPTADKAGERPAAEERSGSD